MPSYEKARGIKTIIECLQERQEKLETQLKIAMQDAEILTRDGTTLVTWKKSKDSETFDKEAFKRDYPELYQQYVTPKQGSRRFLYRD